MMPSLLSPIPNPPSEEELRRSVPTIAPVSLDEKKRPLWSVMIPTYNCAHYLRKALESVLRQAPEPQKMQIEVIDDCSTADDPENVVKVFGKDRVGFYRAPSNRGAIETFNTCIRRARGYWVHILHGDDLVRPSFYQEYEKVIANYRDLALIFGNVVEIDERDQNCEPDLAISDTSGQLIKDFVYKQAVLNQMLFPSVVVKREAYERVGGFNPMFKHVADMDMWFRIGLLSSPYKFEKALSCYRIHSQSDTSRLMITATNVREIISLVMINLKKLGGEAAQVDPHWKHIHARQAREAAEILKRRRSFLGCMNQAQWAFYLQPTIENFNYWCRAYCSHFVYSLLLCEKDARAFKWYMHRFAMLFSVNTKNN